MTAEPLTAPGASPEPGAGDQPAALLAINNIEVIYDDVILVLRGLSLTVPEGQIVALLGSNGAGKSTTLKAVSGLLPSEQGEVASGSITFAGTDITRMDAPERVKHGLSLCMEGRHVFPHLTVAENLAAGGYTKKGNISSQLDFVYEFFPKLHDMRTRTAGFLSGGEQQMLAIGRALMSRPDLLLLDEPSLGLAPAIVDTVFEALGRLQQGGLSMLLVEQDAFLALEFSSRGYVLNSGAIDMEGSSRELLADPTVMSSYLGMD